MNKLYLENGRPGEVIGGGFFVFRRGKRTGRVGCRPNALPFEHPTYESAKKEADRLSSLCPGETFVVFGEYTT